MGIQEFQGVSMVLSPHPLSRWRVKPRFASLSAGQMGFFGRSPVRLEFFANRLAFDQTKIVHSSQGFCNGFGAYVIRH